MSSRPTVLLLSDDPMALALLGLLLELANHAPIFAARGERAEDALARARRAVAVLIDDTFEAARSDVFFARAAQQKAAIAIFPGKNSRRELTARIGERGIPYFEIPADADELARVISTAAATTWWKRSTNRTASE